MKKLIMAAALIAALVVPTLLTTGCKTPSQQRRVFNSMWTLSEFVTASYSSYLDLVISGNLPTNGVPKVSRAYGHFQSDFNSALILVAGNSNAVPTAGLTHSANVFSSELAAAKQGN